jgi:hypothetical protein
VKVLIIFLIEAVALLVAFALLFYVTTMSSTEDNRTLFVRAYLVVLVVLAFSAYKLSTSPCQATSEPNKLVKTEIIRSVWLAVVPSNTINLIKENGYV